MEKEVEGNASRRQPDFSKYARIQFLTSWAS